MRHVPKGWYRERAECFHRSLLWAWTSTQLFNLIEWMLSGTQIYKDAGKIIRERLTWSLEEGKKIENRCDRLLKMKEKRLVGIHKTYREEIKKIKAYKIKKARLSVSYLLQPLSLEQPLLILKLKFSLPELKQLLLGNVELYRNEKEESIRVAIQKIGGAISGEIVNALSDVDAKTGVTKAKEADKTSEGQPC